MTTIRASHTPRPAVRPRLVRPLDIDAELQAIIRATVDETPAPQFDLYDHVCQLLNGRVRR